MNRALLVLGSLESDAQLLRQIMMDSHCTVLRFSEPEQWRENLKQDELGAVVLTSSVDRDTCEYIRWQIHSFAPTARIVVQSDLDKSRAAVVANG